MVYLPEGTSADIVKVYADAFSKIVASDEFKSSSAKQLGKYPQATGKAAVAAQKEAFSIDAKSKTWVKGHLTKKYGVKF